MIYRPLLLASALPEVADARGVSTRRMELCFLIVMALAASMTVFYAGVIAAGFFFVGQGWAAVRRRGSAPRSLPVLSSVH